MVKRHNTPKWRCYTLRYDVLLIIIHLSGCCCLSQGSVATLLKCDGICCYCFANNLLLRMSVKETFENWSTFGKVIGRNIVALFFGHGVLRSVLVTSFYCRRMVCGGMSFRRLLFSVGHAVCRSVGHAFNEINEVWQQMYRRPVVRRGRNLADW